MISYAQNFEDVLLRRVLRDVTAGFYVDVGAQDPVVDSVTKHFYDSGWHGINLEPHPSYFVALRNARPRDINLNLAASDRAQMVQFHFIDHSGLSSTSSGALAVAAAHGLSARTGQVAAERMAAILADHRAGEIHFMKIDVEGGEAAVLRGMDFARWRPWILVIEGTRPNDPTPCWDEFEPLALTARYVPVYFDGLNRWYLREESMARASLFDVPVNVFDRFVRWKEQAWDDLQSKSKRPAAANSFASIFRT